MLRCLSHQLDSLPRRQTVLVSLPARMLGFEVTDMRLEREERGPFCFRDFLESRAEEKRYQCANGVRQDLGIETAEKGAKGAVGVLPRGGLAGLLVDGEPRTGGREGSKNLGATSGACCFDSL